MVRPPLPEHCDPVRDGARCKAHGCKIIGLQAPNRHLVAAPASDCLCGDCRYCQGVRY